MVISSLISDGVSIIVLSSVLLHFTRYYSDIECLFVVGIISSIPDL